ncbi:hypothetical protein Drorol1_Dr00001366 [Drosera rotundifolia]
MSSPQLLFQTLTTLQRLLQCRISPSKLHQIHAQIILLGAHQDNLISTRLINHYPPQISLKIIKNLKSPNILPFNALIKGFSELGMCEKGMILYRELKWRGGDLRANDFTICNVMKGCGGERWGLRQVHCEVVKLGFGSDVYVGNGLVSGYVKWGAEGLRDARKMFNEMPDRGLVVGWSCLIGGCARGGECEDGLRLFLRMVRWEGVMPDEGTLVSVLSACAGLGMEGVEKWVTVLLGEGDNDYVNVVLCYLYGKLGLMDKCRECFDRILIIGKRSVVAWNTMISAYVQNGCASEALGLFRLMMRDRCIRPNHVSMVSVLSACAEIGDTDLGISVHEYIKLYGRKDVIKINSFLATALINMYSKCGHLSRAKDIFDDMVTKDVVAINAMIMGLAETGEGDAALRHFHKMQELRVNPNHGTFLAVLCACCHAGMLEQGRLIFQNMNSRFSIQPQLEHYTCYIDLLSRFGLIEEALKVVTSMPFRPNSYVWSALLGGCLLHSRVEFVQEISRRLVEVEPENSAGYVLLSNALALESRWSDVSGLRSAMKDARVKKQRGSSWISIDGALHEFIAGPPSHPEIDIICFMLDGLVKQMMLSSAP